MKLPMRTAAAIAVAMGLTTPLAAGAGDVPRALGRIPPEIAALTLPLGELVLLSGSPRQLTFEDVERSRFSSSGGIVVSYDVLNPPIPTDQGPAVQMVRSFRVVCASRTVQGLGAVAYDGNGGVVMWLPADAPRSGADGLAAGHLKLVCDGARPPSQAVTGHRAAFAFAGRVFASWAGHKD